MNNFNVSVVIPAYNEETRIARAIQSVLNQSLPVKEIIVVDDGSSDNTAKVVEKFGGFVKCIHQTNHGLAAARNIGIISSVNEWIAFLDGDDEWLSNHVYNAWEVLNYNPYTVWYCAAFEQRSENGEIIYSSHLKKNMFEKGIIKNYFYAQAKTSFSCSSSMIVKKKVFTEVGLFDIEINHLGEDLDMWFRIALRYPNIGYSNSIACIYWRREGSITTKEKIVNIPKLLKE